MVDAPAALPRSDAEASGASPLGRLARHVVFPGTLVGGLWAGHALLERGTPPEAVIVIWFALMPWVATLERLMPRHADWNRSRGDLRTDAIYLPTSLLVGGALSALWAGLYLQLAIGLQRVAGQGLWPAAWPLAAQVVFACLLAELFAYWAHRWMHASPLLWRFHSVHHSPTRVYWLNAVRAHPGEHLFRGFISGMPLAVIGAPPEVLAYVMVVARVAGLFQHANVDFALGPFAWLFSIGELHRWHHSARREEADHNYGDTLIVWDVVFGSRLLPKDRPAPRAVGIAGLEAYPAGWWAQLAAPFRLEAIARASRPASQTDTR